MGTCGINLEVHLPVVCCVLLRVNVMLPPTSFNLVLCPEKQTDGESTKLRERMGPVSPNIDVIRPPATDMTNNRRWSDELSPLSASEFKLNDHRLRTALRIRFWPTSKEMGTPKTGVTSKCVTRHIR